MIDWLFFYSIYKSYIMKLFIDKKNIHFYDYYSVVPLLFYLGLTYQSLCNKEFQSFSFALFILFADVIVSLIKRIPYDKKSWFYPHTRRPKGANRCDYLSRNMDYTDESPGLPSGHMTTTSIFASYMIMKHPTLHYILIHVIMVVVMGMARYYKKCHTLLQIGLGTILGICLGLSYYIMEKRFNERYT